MKLSVTPSAAKHILASLAKRPHMKGIRIFVKKTGCSGYAYGLEFAERLDMTSDSCLIIEDITFIYDKHHIPFLDGLTIDYRQEGLNSGFALEHPKATDRCGCGESFQFDASS